MAKKEWCDKLSLVNKAEILAAVVHILTSHMPKVWAQVPKWYQKQLSFAMYDCSVDMKEFSEKDLKQIREYFGDFNKKHPQPKTKEEMEKTMPKTKKVASIFQLESENLSGLGGAMGTERTWSNWTKPFVSLEAAKEYAEKDYIKQTGKKNAAERPIVWVRENSRYVRSEDMGFVMYHVRRVKVA